MLYSNQKIIISRLRQRFFFGGYNRMFIKKKAASTFQSRPLIYIHNHLPSFPPFGFHSAGRLLRLQFLFVFRRLQSLQLLLPTHPCLPLSLQTSLGRPVSGLSPLPFRFLTSAVSAFFRPLQFWILTTQPLLFLSFSSRFCLADASPVPDSALASSVSPFSPA